ncbi:MAG: hypothetical protein KBB75_00705 [Candidatus Pacebacteria bacterium]|jgi:hypothetical protein|nr:hypothetical protein [Candidatus Paceibacterota bacterium]
MKKIFVRAGSGLFERDPLNLKKVIEVIFAEEKENIKIFTSAEIKNFNESSEKFDMVFVSGTTIYDIGGIARIKQKLTPTGKIISFSCDHSYLRGWLFEETDYAFYCWHFDELLTPEDDEKLTILKQDCLEIIRTGKSIQSKEQIEYLARKKSRYFKEKSAAMLDYVWKTLFVLGFSSVIIFFVWMWFRI